MSSPLYGHSAPLVVAFAGLIAALLRHVVSIRFVLTAQRQRLRSSSGWLRLTHGWHLPLLLLGFALAATRLAFFSALHRIDSAKEEAQGGFWLRLWLTLPSTICTIAAGYLVTFHAQLVFFGAWPVRFGAISPSLRGLFVLLSALLVGVCVLLAYARAATPAELLSDGEWEKMELSFNAAVWILVGALLLKYQSASAELLWSENDAGRPVVLPPRAIHKLLVTQTFFSLVLLLRGVMAGMVAVCSTDSSESVQPRDLSAMAMQRFLMLYGVWDFVTLAIVYRLCAVVPAISQAKRLAFGKATEHWRSSGEAAMITDPRQRPIFHLCVPSPAEAMAEYLRPASIIGASHARISRHPSQSTDQFRVRGTPDPVEDCALSSAHEPLLSSRDSDSESDDSQLNYY